MPQIEVTFDIDANGIVNVSAKDKATNKEQQIRIQASGGLSDSDVDRMVKDAESHAAEDKKRRELVDAKNHGEAMIHTTQKSLEEFGSKVAQSDKSAVESAISALKSALEGERYRKDATRPERTSKDKKLTLGYDEGQIHVDATLELEPSGNAFHGTFKTSTGRKRGCAV